MRRSKDDGGIQGGAYRELVWLAYLALPPGGGDQRRLVLAHRLAAAAVRRRGDAVEARQRLLRAVLRRRVWPWTGRLAGVRALPAPARGADAGFADELDGLSAVGRAAYVLSRREGRDREQVVEILSGAGASDPGGALTEVDELEERAGTGRTPAHDPTLARLYGRGPDRTWLKVAAVAAVCVVAGALFTAGRNEHAEAQPQEPAAPARAAADAWRRSTVLDLATWPARGSLTGDRAFVLRAQRRWGGAASRLLFAGTVGEARVVLLHGLDKVARYTETEGGEPSLELFEQPRTKPDGASPLKLWTGPGGSRYLVPPWVREVSTARLETGGPRWRSVPVQDGVTAPVAAAEPGHGCWRGPVLRLRAPEIAHGMPYTMFDFGRLTSANGYYQPPPPADVNRFGPAEIDTVPGGFDLWRRLGCAVDRPQGEVQGATAWEFWAGRLPEKATGRWVCLRLTYADGGSSVRGVLLTTAGGRTTAALTAARADTWDCSRLRRDIVAGAWWRAPSGKRYYVAAGSRRTVAIQVSGRTAAAVQVFSTWSSAKRPRLSAVNELGDHEPVLQ